MIKLSDFYTPHGIATEFTTTLASRLPDGKTSVRLEMVTRPFHPIKVLFRTMIGEEKVWEGLLLEIAIEKYNEIKL